jgi:hypothetical protein
MSQGADKMKAKLAGVFVTFKGLFTVLYLLYQVTQGTSLNFLIGIDLALGAALFFAGIAVITASKKGYIFAVMMAFIELVFSFLSLSLLGILIDLAVLGAIKKGYDIEIKGSNSSPSNQYSKPGTNY